MILAAMVESLTHISCARRRRVEAAFIDHGDAG